MWSAADWGVYLQFPVSGVRSVGAGVKSKNLGGSKTSRLPGRRVGAGMIWLHWAMPPWLVARVTKRHAVQFVAQVAPGVAGGVPR